MIGECACCRRERDLVAVLVDLRSGVDLPLCAECAARATRPGEVIAGLRRELARDPSREPN